MAAKIRLMRLGKIRAPYYRIVVADSRTKRDGRVIETIGKYHPKADPSFIEVDSARAQYWLGVGAQPTEPVLAILKVTGDWQQFKGLPAPERGLQTAPARPDRKAIFEAAAKESLDDAEAKPAKKTTAKKTTAKKAASEPAPAAEPEAAPQAEAAPEADAAPSESAAEAAPEADAAPSEPAGEEAASEEPAAESGEPAAEEAATAEPAAEPSEPAAGEAADAAPTSDDAS